MFNGEAEAGPLAGKDPEPGARRYVAGASFFAPR